EDGGEVRLVAADHICLDRLRLREADLEAVGQPRVPGGIGGRARVVERGVGLGVRGVPQLRVVGVRPLELQRPARHAELRQSLQLVLCAQRQALAYACLARRELPDAELLRGWTGLLRAAG